MTIEVHARGRPTAADPPGEIAAQPADRGLCVPPIADLDAMDEKYNSAVLRSRNL